MNILYISPMNIDRKNLDGVARKILAQCHAFESYKDVDNVYIASYFEEDKYLIIGKDYEQEIKYKKKSSKQLELIHIYPSMVKVCVELNIQSVYFRILSLSWITNKLFKDLNKQGVSIAVEIPTYPFWKEKWLDVRDKFAKGKIMTAAKRSLTNTVYFIYTRNLKKYVKIIVTFSDVERLWGLPVIGIANGYNFSQVNEIKNINTPDSELHLLMVASIRDNHGADRVIKGLEEYMKTGGARSVIFHIVGDGEAIPRLKKFVEQNQIIKKAVVFHGFKAGEELEKIYDIVDIGISALGFHRLGVWYASPLKSKEYFAKGLPVVGTTVEHDVLKSACSKYYLAIPEDDTSLEIDKVCKFYNELYESGCTNAEIVQVGADNFDWKNIMKSVYEAIR